MTAYDDQQMTDDIQATAVQLNKLIRKAQTAGLKVTVTTQSIVAVARPETSQVFVSVDRPIHPTFTMTARQ